MSRASSRSLLLPMGARPGDLGGGRNEKGVEKSMKRSVRALVPTERPRSFSVACWVV